MLKLLKFLLIVGGFALMVSNIDPYLRVTELLFQGAGDVCKPIQGFPGIGDFLVSGCRFVASIIIACGGYLLWIIFQIIELLPIANNYSIPFLSGLLGRLQNAPQVSKDAGDRDAIVQVKKRGNTIVERSLGALLTASWIFYIIDLLLMAWLYKPLNEIGDLNIIGLVRTLLGVFATEVIILGILLIDNVIDPRRIKFQEAQQKNVREY